MLSEIDDERPKPVPEEEKARSADLLRRVDEAVDTLKGEAEGLKNAREQYRQRLEGNRGRH